MILLFLACSFCLLVSLTIAIAEINRTSDESRTKEPSSLSYSKKEGEFFGKSKQICVTTYNTYGGDFNCK